MALIKTWPNRKDGSNGLPEIEAIVGEPSSAEEIGFDQMDASNYATLDITTPPASGIRVFGFQLTVPLPSTLSATAGIFGIGSEGNGQGWNLWLQSNGLLHFEGITSAATIRPTRNLLISAAGTYWIFVQPDPRTVGDGGITGTFIYYVSGSAVVEGSILLQTANFTIDDTQPHHLGNISSEGFIGDEIVVHQVAMWDFGDTNTATGVLGDISDGTDFYQDDLIWHYTGFTNVAEEVVSALTGKPEQFYLVHDALAAGASVINSATSEYGPRLGPVQPAATNHGSIVPSILGDPDESTDLSLAFEVIRGGGIGSAEWAYRGADSVWYGYNGDEYLWGIHSPKGVGSNPAGVVVYSSVFKRIVVLTANGGVPGTGNVEIRYADKDARPQDNDGWTAGGNFTPVNGVSADDVHALAACELRDGTILLVVRNAKIGSAANVVDQGDFDVYRSIDGALTWKRAAERIVARYFGNSTNVEFNTSIRLEASGDWVRFCFWSGGGGTLESLASSDGGATWKSTDSYNTDVAAILSTSNHDEQPFDLIGLDNNTGTFMVVFRGGTDDLNFLYASGEDAWTLTTIGGEIGAFTSTLTRSMAFIRGPYFLDLWINQFNGSALAVDAWSLLQVPRDSALVPSSWKNRDDMLKTRLAARYRAIQMSGAWVGDRGALLYYVEDGEATPPNYVVTRPLLSWVGGWSGKPLKVDTDLTDNVVENIHWDYLQGIPAGSGAASSASAGSGGWLFALIPGGTFTWSGQGVNFLSNASGNNVTQAWTQAISGTDEPHQWDPDFAVEQKAILSERWVAEWALAAGNTLDVSADNIAVRLQMPSEQAANEGWDFSIRHGATGILLYDNVAGAPALTLTGLSLAGGVAGGTFHRFRFCVSPATTEPSFFLMARDETGGEWQTAGPLQVARAAVGFSDPQYIFGQGGVNTALVASRWREFRILSRWIRTNYAHPSGINIPDDYAGALASLVPLGLGAGATASTPGKIRVPWSGGSGVLGDTYAWEMNHTHPAEHMFLDSPQYPYLSATGATAGALVTFDAEGDNHTGNRWSHNAAAFYGTGGAEQITLEYASSAAFSALQTQTTISLVQASDLRVDESAGNVFRWSATVAGSSRIRDGSLMQRFVKITAGTTSGKIGHVHKISRHWTEDGYHYVELSNDGQFSPTLIAAGDTFSVLSDRGFFRWPQVITGRRFARLTFGATGQNSWDGRWRLDRLVLGIAKKFDPPLLWHFNDADSPDTVVVRGRSGASWAYEQAPPSRRITGRWIGDDLGARRAFRDAMRGIAAYQVQPIALILDDDHKLGEEGDLLLTRFDGGVNLDEQTWYAGPNGQSFKRPAGDMQVFFKEIV